MITHEQRAALDRLVAEWDVIRDGPAPRLRDLRQHLADDGEAQLGIRMTAFAAIEPEEVSYLWPARVPLGMLTLLIGDPGLGKSLLTVHVAAKVSRAGADVVLSSAEDHAAATVRPRLDAAGADLTRVHRVEVVDEDGLPRTVELPGDVDALAAKVDETKARLLVVDPLTAHLGEAVNSWRDQSVRRALAPLHRLAEEHGCAVVIVAHLNKAIGVDPLYRTGGSIGIPAAVRSALLLARDPDDPEGDRGSNRVLCHVKSNIGPLAESLLYRVEPAEPDTARLCPLGGSEIAARDLLAAAVGEERTKRDDAADFLREELSDGPRPVKALQAAAGDAGIGWRTIEDAKHDLSVTPTKTDFSGGWLWQLPEDRNTEDRNTDEDRNSNMCTTTVLGETHLQSQMKTANNSEDREGRKAAEIPGEAADLGLEEVAQ